MRVPPKSTIEHNGIIYKAGDKLPDSYSPKVEKPIEVKKVNLQIEDGGEDE